MNCSTNIESESNLLWDENFSGQIVEVNTDRKLHLLVGEHPILNLEGRYGCDYRWSDDFSSFRCMPHRYNPNGGDEAYIAYETYDSAWEGRYEDDCCPSFEHPFYGETLCSTSAERPNSDGSDFIF